MVASAIVGDEEEEELAGEGLPCRMSVLEGSVFGGCHDEVLDGDLVELSKGLSLSHGGHVIQAKTEAELLQVRRLMEEKG